MALVPETRTKVAGISGDRGLHPAARITTLSAPRMGQHLSIIVPLLAAFVYAVAALMLKRATERGIGPWRVTFVTNWIQAAMFAPLWLFGGQPFAWTHLWQCAIAALAFFSGQIFTFLALSRGDVSVATPVLGTKVIFVAGFAILFAAEPLSTSLWIAALLTSISTALLGGGRTERTAAAGKTLLFGFIAAASFALTDVLCLKWAPSWGFTHFAPAMFFLVALYALALIPFFRGNLRELPWHWLAPGAVLLGVQASGIAYSIIVLQSATTTNILYNSRGIWSVVLVWTIGHWFGNRERGQGHAVMFRRLAGSVLLLVAILFVVRR